MDSESRHNLAWCLWLGVSRNHVVSQVCSSIVIGRWFTSKPTHKAVFSLLLAMGLSRGVLTAWQLISLRVSWESAEARGWLNKTFHHFCHIFVRSKLLGPAYTQGTGIVQGSEYSSQGPLGADLEAAYYTYDLQIGQISECTLDALELICLNYPDILLRTWIQ